MSGGDGYDSTAATLAHVRKVRGYIDVFVAEMLARGRAHDASKLEHPEKATLDRVLPLLDGVAYGSPDYQAVVEQARPALEHHYRRNSHHPEHYGEAGVAGMDLFDLVEMVCDWMAAAERNPADGVRLAHNVGLFGIEPQLASIIGNTLARWPTLGPEQGSRGRAARVSNVRAAPPTRGSPVSGRFRAGVTRGAVAGITAGGMNGAGGVGSGHARHQPSGLRAG